MQPTSAERPVRRILAISAIVLPVAIAGALLYDTPTPDNSTFLPEPLPVVPNADNGLLLIASPSAPDFDVTSGEQDALWGAFSTPEKWDTAAASRFLKKNQPALENWTTALTLRPWVRPADRFEGGVGNIGGLNLVAPVAVADAFYTGRPNTGIAHSQRVLETSALLESAGFGIEGFAIAQWLRRYFHDALRTITPNIPDRSTAASLLELLNRHPPDPTAWGRALRAEFSYLLQQAAISGRDSTAIRRTEFLSAEGRFMSPLLYKPNLTLQRYLDACLESADNAQGPYSSRTSIQIENALAANPGEWFELLDPNLAGSAILSFRAIELGRFEGRNWRTRFLHARSSLTLALHLYQLDHDDQIPASLNHLVPTYLPDLPTDPYDAAPLRYDPVRRVIWSVGENLTDDGGFIDPEDTDNTDWDNPTFPIPTPR